MNINYVCYLRHWVYIKALYKHDASKLLVGNVHLTQQIVLKVI